MTCHKLFLFRVNSGLCSPCHFTCEGLEGFHFKGLLANFGKIHFQLGADVVLLQAFADLKYFVCDALWSGSWKQSRGQVRNDVLREGLRQAQMIMWTKN